MVELVRTTGKTIGQGSRELDLIEAAVREWVRKAADEQVEASATLEADVHAELRAAERRIRELEMEREIPTR